MKVALVCPTVGQTQRGYERFFSDLLRVLQPDLDVHLFKGGGGNAPHQTLVPHLSRSGALARYFGPRMAYRRYQAEHASFALMLAPALWRGGFDVVHVIDPPLAHHLARLRSLARLQYRLLFSHGGPALVDPGAGVDHVHCLTDAARMQLQTLGVSAARSSVLPVGVALDRFVPSLERAALRQAHGVGPEQFVVLCVGAVNRDHKRIHHLIEEMSCAGGDALLWLDGSLHPHGDPTLLLLAQEKLGGRFRYTQVESSRVGELYAMADLMVSAAVEETFGMAVVEAMSAGLPVVVHDSPHFATLLGGGAHRINMQTPGALAQALGDWMAGRRPLAPPQDSRQAVSRFGWDSLRKHYIDMYRRLLVS